MTDILTDLSPSSLAMAIKANLYAFFQSCRYSSKATVHDSSHGFRWHTNVSHPWFNGILSTLSPTADATQTVHDTLNYFQSHNINSFTWWLAPHLEPTVWSQHLLPHGFQYVDNTPGMAIDLAALPLPVQHPLTIRQVEDRQMLAEWTRILVRGFEMPEEMIPDFLAFIGSLGTNLPFRHYLGFLNDQPVAASTLFLGAGVAGIYNVATVTAARGQGIGSAMTLAPLVEAHDMGYRVGILQSSDMGYRMYQRLGFQKLCQIDHFYLHLS
jgi:ribosomal protein S18 acetylase RimI-like enzyme